MHFNQITCVTLDFVKTISIQKEKRELKNEVELEWLMARVRSEQGRLRSFIRSLGVRTEAVDDLAQDAFIVAFEKRADFVGNTETEFSAWIRGIARKLVANALRKESRRQKFLSDPVTEILLQVEKEQLHPLNIDAESGQLVALSKCLESLPANCRHIIRMRYFEERTPGAIASLLERSANDVRQMLFRVRKALLKCIEERSAHVS